jgi:hypothetical protein
MNEKAQEEDEFEDDEPDEIASGDDVDVDHLFRDLEKRKRASPKVGDPAWRKLERIREEQRTAELVSDFDDYDIRDAGEEEPRASTGRARSRHVS